MAQTRRNVVIIGGGSAGFTVARLLGPKLDTTRFNIIVINPRPVLVHLPALLRVAATSEGSLEKAVLMPFAGSLGGKGEIKVGVVASFTEKKDGSDGEVVLVSGERIPYAVLVLTPGSIWEGPLKLPDSVDDILQHFAVWREKIERAKSIVLVGGGAVGAELVGELRDFHSDKEITIVHSKPLLLNEAYPDKYRTSLTQRLRKTGATVILDDYVDVEEPNEDGTVVTRNGNRMQADLVIPTRGGRPNTELIGTSLGAGSLSSSGHVKVLPTLQLPNHLNIFAGGDVIEWNEQKQAAKVTAHATIIVKNILTVLSGENANAVYKGSSEMIVTTIGRRGGATYLGVLWGLTFGDWFSATVKSKTLLIEMVRKTYDLGHL